MVCRSANFTKSTASRDSMAGGDCLQVSACSITRDHSLKLTTAHSAALYLRELAAGVAGVEGSTHRQHGV